MQNYLNALRENLDHGVQSEYFGHVIASLDVAYKAMLDPPPEVPLIFGRLLLICHKSMLSAAALIAQAQPEDSVGITRRAIEAARVALAIKLDGENAQRWASFAERHDRWVKRQEGKKPKRLHIALSNLADEPMAEELDRWCGILSDSFVHFTPEFYASLDWSMKTSIDGGGEVFLNYFQRDKREIDRHYMMLAAAHTSILKVFDRCLDWGERDDQTKSDVLDRFLLLAKLFADRHREELHISDDDDSDEQAEQ